MLIKRFLQHSYIRKTFLTYFQSIWRVQIQNQKPLS
jgi:hypothetical protein